MASRLIPCPSCARHVRVGDAACPFCGAATAPEPPPDPRVGRMSRAAFLAMGAATSLALTECSSSDQPQPLYGGSPFIENSQDGGSGEDGGRVVADAGVGKELDAAPASKDSGGTELPTDGGPYAQPLYGAFVGPVTPTDAGTTGPQQDSGEPIVTLYGGFAAPLTTKP